MSLAVGGATLVAPPGGGDRTLDFADGTLDFADGTLDFADGTLDFADGTLLRVERTQKNADSTHHFDFAPPVARSRWVLSAFFWVLSTAVRRVSRLARRLLGGFRGDVTSVGRVSR